MNKVESRKLKRLRGRLELGPPVGFYADRFLISGGKQIKTHSFSKNKEKSKIHNDKSIASKSFRKYFILRSVPSSTQRAWSDQNQAGAIYGSVNSKRAHPQRHFSGICHFVFFFLEKLQMLHGGAGRSYKNPKVGGFKMGCKCLTPGQHQNFISQ